MLRYVKITLLIVLCMLFLNFLYFTIQAKADANYIFDSSVENGIFFPGTTDSRITIPNNNGEFNFGTGDFTIAWWQRVSSRVTHWQRVFQLDDGQTNSTQFSVSEESDGNIYFWMNNNLIAGASMNQINDSWEHFAVVRSSGQINIYKNGIAIGDSNSSESAATAPSNLNLVISGNWTAVSGTVSGAFDGAITGFEVSKQAIWTDNFTPPVDYSQIANRNLVIFPNTSFSNNGIIDLTSTFELGEITSQGVSFLPRDSIVDPSPSPSESYIITKTNLGSGQVFLSHSYSDDGYDNAQIDAGDEYALEIEIESGYALTAILVDGEEVLLNEDNWDTIEHIFTLTNIEQSHEISIITNSLKVEETIASFDVFSVPPSFGEHDIPPILLRGESGENDYFWIDKVQLDFDFFVDESPLPRKRTCRITDTGNFEAFNWNVSDSAIEITVYSPSIEFLENNCSYFSEADLSLGHPTVKISLFEENNGYTTLFDDLILPLSRPPVLIDYIENDSLTFGSEVFLLVDDEYDLNSAYFNFFGDEFQESECSFYLSFESMFEPESFFENYYFSESDSFLLPKIKIPTINKLNENCNESFVDGVNSVEPYADRYFSVSVRNSYGFGFGQELMLVSGEELVINDELQNETEATVQDIPITSKSLTNTPILSVKSKLVKPKYAQISISKNGYYQIKLNLPQKYKNRIVQMYFQGTKGRLVKLGFKKTNKYGNLEMSTRIKKFKFGKLIFKINGKTVTELVVK